MNFHEVSFPLSLALGATASPMRRSEIVNLSSGREVRNQRWRRARRRFEVASAVKTLDELYLVVQFFEARRGQLYGFRFKDPSDFRSSGPMGPIYATDQLIGIGDGERAAFQLSKGYGDHISSFRRKIDKPVASSVKIAVNGEGIDASAYGLDSATGVVTFAPDYIPQDEAEVTAGFEFEVPVRFDIEQIDINLSHFHAGHVPNISLVEIMP